MIRGLGGIESMDKDENVDDGKWADADMKAKSKTKEEKEEEEE